MKRMRLYWHAAAEEPEGGAVFSDQIYTRKRDAIREAKRLAKRLGANARPMIAHWPRDIGPVRSDANYEEAE